MNHVPVAIGLVICEQVIVDVATRNVTPVNCFSRRRLTEFPGAMSFHVVAWLADGFGELSVEVVIRRMDSMDELFRREERLRFHDRLKDMRFTAQIRDCPFPIAGYYEIGLNVDGEFVAHRKIQVYS